MPASKPCEYDIFQAARVVLDVFAIFHLGFQSESSLLWLLNNGDDDDDAGDDDDGCK